MWRTKCRARAISIRLLIRRFAAFFEFRWSLVFCRFLIGGFVILFQSTLRDLHVVCCFAWPTFWWRMVALLTLAEQILPTLAEQILLTFIVVPGFCASFCFFVGCQVFGFPVLGCMERVCFVFLGVLTAPAAALQLQHLHGHAQQPTEGEDLRAAAPGARQVVQGHSTRLASF